ncbi:phage tail tape measure protein [Virgibacillus sp. CBA3643]|uniref:phage tail tape measure protein n=1 Tax=Virgibacillus sp. CBA3643 TaxID=2942278 RepID=UPI0035A34635
MANTVEVTVKGIDQASKVFEDVESSANNAFSNVDESISGVDDSLSDMSGLEINTSEAESSIQSASDSISSVDDSLASVGDLEIGMGGAESSVQGISDSIQGVDDSMQGVGDSAQTVGGKIKDAFSGIADNWDKITIGAGGAGLATEGFARSQGETNATLERTSIATGETTESLRDSAEAMSNHTFATGDAVEGMEMLVQRGIDTQGQFEEILPHVDTLADATGQELPEAINSADKLLKPFGDDLNDVGENSDQMARLIQQTDVPLSTMERNLGRVPEELEGLGFGLDDAAAGIEVFRDQGYTGQEAVREFRRAVEESEGDMSAFKESLGLTNEEWENYQSKVEPNIGLSEDMAEANNDQMTTMEKLSQNMENAMTKYGGLAQAAGALAPVFMALGPAIKGVSAATRIFNTVIRANPIMSIVSLITALLIPAIIYLWQNWDEVSQWLAESWEWIKATAIVVFTAIGDFLSSTWEWIKEKSISIWQSISQFFSDTWNSITEKASAIFTALGLFFSTIWFKIKQVAMTVWNAIVSTVVGIWNKISERAQTVFNALSSFFSQIWETIKSVSSSVWNAITNTLSSIWDGIKSTATSVFSAVSSFFSQIWATIKSVTSSVWNAITSVLSSVWDGISSTASSIFNGIKNVLSSIWNTISSVTSSVWNGITSTLGGIWDGLSGTVSSIFNGIKDTITDVWDSISGTTSDIWDGIVDTIKGAINGVIDAINGMLNSISDIGIDLPELPGWVPGDMGGGSISFPSIPNIPKLATGGVVSKPTIAQVGDAGAGNPEIVAPQDMIRSIIADELKNILSMFNPQANTPQQIIVPVSIDGKEVARVTAPHMDRELGKKRGQKSRARGD